MPDRAPIAAPRSPSNPPGLYPLVRLFACLALMTVGGSAMYGAIVGLPPVSAEFGTGRGAGSLPYTCFMVGFGVGGVVMGRIADRFGIMLPAAIATLGLPGGFFVAAQASSLVEFSAAVGLLCGFAGASFTFAPLVSDISHWFTARRGLAIAIVISGTYVAGALWPPVLQHYIDLNGWRWTFSALGWFALAAMVLLSALLYRRSPAIASGPGRDAEDGACKPLGFRPGTLQCLICAAGIGCCAAMAMPQVHIVPHVMDLGYTAARGAEMLSLMLGCGIVSRIVSGWVSDRIGGLPTLLLGSGLQASVLAAFLFADTLTALYITSVAFGLSQGGIVPSYAVIVRTFFPAGEAGWRIALSFLFTIMGMALGGWMAGVLYDLTGSYTVSFLNAIAFNVLNMVIAVLLFRRARAGIRAALAPA